MQVVEKVIPYTRSHSVRRLYFIGDLHAGTLAHCEDNLDDAINTIKLDDDALWVGCGDYGEFITPDDKRWDFDMVSKWVDKSDIAESQQDYVVRKFRPIKDKCLGLQWGNHEYQYAIHKNQKIHDHICNKLKVKNLGFSCFLDLTFKREKSNDVHLIRCCGTHGSSNAITPSGKQNILWRWMQGNEAVIYWYAHMHDILHKPKGYLAVDQRKRLVNKEALGVVTGGFFKTYVEGSMATYGERRNYSLNKIGYPVIEMDVEDMTLTFIEKVYMKI